jgi:predicted lipid-binding transport protein (Tim44 family)
MKKMLTLCRKITPVFAVLFTLFLVDGGLIADTADARSKRGGSSFKSAPKKAPAAPAQNTAGVQQKKSGGFAKGLAGGLLGGAIGSMLFGSMFGGEGTGILPILLFAALGFFLFRRFGNSRQKASGQGGGFAAPGQGGVFSQGMGGNMANVPQPVPGSPQAVEEGLNEIRRTDRAFDTAQFLEIASDAFFQVQAGWMRRDLDSYRNLLGEKLASEYAVEFAQMREKGIINKLESIAVRKADVVAAGNTGTQDFITVGFSANLLDYTVDETTGELVDGSMTRPVKFDEEWTWARPAGTNDWKLEGIAVVGE